MNTTTQIIINLIPYAATILIGAAGSYFLIFKKKLKKFRQLIDDIDDAVTDDAISEAEFQSIYAGAKALMEA